ncbi:hypothetical protein M2419_002515 [Sphingobacterium sp. BIGb0116]|nr:hypothetical protein [Sphingobacterium sp. BIGb0116]
MQSYCFLGDPFFENNAENVSGIFMLKMKRYF